VDRDAAKTVAKLESQVASLCEALADAYEELNILYDLSEAMASDTGPREMISLVLRRAVEATDASSGAIFLSQEEGPSAYVLEGGETKVQEEVAGNLATGWDQDVVKQVMTSGKAQLGDDSMAGPSMLCVPLKANGRVSGVILLKGKRVGDWFTSGDLKLLSVVAGQMGLAIENATLQDGIKQRAAEVMRLWIRSRRLTLTNTEVQSSREGLK